MAAADHPSARWLSRLRRDGQPVYVGLVQALEAAIREGELQGGDQLPPQRTVAELVGVDLTTVTRAYAAARARGLIEGTVGRGTFVRAGAAEDEAGLVDLSMNLAPPPQGLSLGGLLSETLSGVLARTDPAALMAYHPGGGSLGQKIAAAAWLAPVLGEAPPERMLISPGAQTGLAAILGAVCRPGDALAVEPLVYPGLLSLARQMGLRLLACSTDGQGPDPERLAALCGAERPVALYLTPTTHNPTAVTLDLARRRELAEVARAADILIVEDDPYSRLFDTPLPAIATLAPERTFHLATLSKVLSPGLRTAFLLPPPGLLAERTAESLRAVALMPSPLITAAVTAWIRDGTAEQLLAGVRREARARRALAAEVLPQARGAPEAIHVWLDLPADWAPGRVHRVGQDAGVSLVTADAFATGPDHPNGLRISLGGPAKRATLKGALEAVATLVAGGAPTPRVVV